MTLSRSVRALRSPSALLAVALVLAGCGTVPPSPAPSPAPAQAVDPAAAAATPSAPVAAPAPAPIDAAAEPQRRLAVWLEDIRVRARAAGVREATLHAALDGAQYLPRVVELDRAQPEFSRPVWAYLDTAVSDQRVANGLEKKTQVQREADAAAARYGVPVEVLLAIWGMESNYGGNFGNTPTIDALATLGVDGRREDFARRELLAALSIIDKGDIDRVHMVGSWAGAMGQTQFMPSNFLAYAVDGDGDGRRDIWGSMADVMASTGNFMARAGWQPGSRWGVEVRLPSGFDVARADPSVRQASALWAAEGVQAMSGDLPDIDQAELLLPAGARGPAFLVGPNFRALLRYNNATSYALGVGLLSQRLSGGPGVVAPWPRDLRSLSRSELKDLQDGLNRQGFASGTPDGVVGPATRQAIRAYQRSVGLVADGYPTDDLLQRLR